MTALGIGVTTRDNDYFPWTYLYEQERKCSPEENAYRVASEESVELWRKYIALVDKWEDEHIDQIAIPTVNQSDIDAFALKCEAADRRARELYLKWMATYKES